MLKRFKTAAEATLKGVNVYDTGSVPTPRESAVQKCKTWTFIVSVPAFAAVVVAVYATRPPTVQQITVPAPHGAAEYAALAALEPSCPCRNQVTGRDFAHVKYDDAVNVTTNPCKAVMELYYRDNDAANLATEMIAYAGQLCEAINHVNQQTVDAVSNYRIPENTLVAKEELEDGIATAAAWEYYAGAYAFSEYIMPPTASIGQARLPRAPEVLASVVVLPGGDWASGVGAQCSCEDNGSDVQKSGGHCYFMPYYIPAMTQHLKDIEYYMDCRWFPDFPLLLPLELLSEPNFIYKYFAPSDEWPGNDASSDSQIYGVWYRPVMQSAFSAPITSAFNASGQYWYPSKTGQVATVGATQRLIQIGLNASTTPISVFAFNKSTIFAYNPSARVPDMWDLVSNVWRFTMPRLGVWVGVSTTASSTPNFNGTRPWLAFSPGVLTASRMGHGGSITQHGGYPALQVDYNAFMSRCDAALCNYASTQGPTPLEFLIVFLAILGGGSISLYWLIGFVAGCYELCCQPAAKHVFVVPYEDVGPVPRARRSSANGRQGPSLNGDIGRYNSAPAPMGAIVKVDSFEESRLLMQLLNSVPSANVRASQIDSVQDESQSIQNQIATIAAVLKAQNERITALAGGRLGSGDV